MESPYLLKLNLYISKHHLLVSSDVEFLFNPEQCEDPIPDDITSIIKSTVLEFLLRIETSDAHYKLVDAEQSMCEI